MTRAGVLLAGLLLAATGLLGAVPPADAATLTVHLTNDGPRPVSLTLRPGDAVTFVNDDTVPHEVRSEGAWQYDSGPVPPSQTSSATPRLTAPGTYRYSDLRGIVFLPQTFTGRLVVPAPKPPPTPRPTHTTSPAPVPSPTRTTAPATSPPPVPHASATPVVPPLPRPTSSGGVVPLPSVPPPTTVPSASPAAVPTDLRYGEPRALAQPSPHRYGLPAVLAGLAIGGVLSLLGRYLLAQPEGRRTGSS